MIRSLLFLQAQPGRGGELLSTLERLGVLAVAGDDPGILGIEVAASIDDGDDIVIVGSWASREHYERWRTGPAPARLAHELEGLVASAPVSRIYHVVEAVS